MTGSEKRFLSALVFTDVNQQEYDQIAYEKTKGSTAKKQQRQDQVYWFKSRK
jgi:hypothetical protein